jgi:hypothetical protein
MFEKKRKTRVEVYRVTRPIFYFGERVEVGQMIELPRWMGVNLTSAGRVELRDEIEGFDVVEVTPAFRGPGRGITQR